LELAAQATNDQILAFLLQDRQLLYPESHSPVNTKYFEGAANP
jgi:hypothetical protein